MILVAATAAGLAPARPAAVDAVVYANDFEARPGTAFPGGDKRVRLADVRDKQSETILVAESADSGIHWSQSRDLDIDRMSFRINDPSRPGLSSRHDGRYHLIPRTRPAE